MSVTVTTLDCSRTVNQIVTAHPSTLAVFEAWGIDTCCGGQHAVKEVVRRHGLDGEALCRALQAVVQES